MSEKEIAATVVAWLADGWDVYQEVEGRCGVADIVAVELEAPNRVWIIEVKKSFSLAVLAQAWHWIKAGAAHRVSVAVPMGKNWKARTFTEEIAKTFGIGVLYVDTSVRESVDPKLQRKLVAEIKVREEHKSHAKAGSQGGYWTPFKQTCKAVKLFVAENPGCTGRELVDGIEHHYATSASARGSLLSWAKSGKVAGVKVGDERPGRFWPA